MKALPDHNLRREFAVGAVAIVSQNIWKSKLYINAEGQLFLNLKKFEGFKSKYFNVRYRYYPHKRLNIVLFVIRICFENCCFGCRLWLLGQFQRLVCKLVLKGLVPSHSGKSFGFSQWGIINIWINFDWHYKGLWTWSSSSNQHF
jgi:hypothetical protein